MKFLPLKNWALNSRSPFSPFIIAGPCAAENREQLFSTAEMVAKIPAVSYFRAGVWKPRTRPGYFQGAGEEALSWLLEIKEKTGLKIAVEVGTPKQAELCLKNRIDAIWLGARTTVNPFYVEEIAYALKGASDDLVVMVKNPLHADLDAWVGSIERIYNAGIRKVVAIHRGCYSYRPQQYRNNPNWSMALNLRQLLPSLPIIVDPSHIAGKRAYIEELSQYALDLSFDGLMIESHISPEQALSDQAQQLTPADLQTLLRNLKVRELLPDNKTILLQLESLREEIDKYDQDLLDAMSARMEIVKKIGEIKAMSNLSLYQSDRWNEIIQDRLLYGQSCGLNEKFVNGLFQNIHAESIDIQKHHLENRQ